MSLRAQIWSGILFTFVLLIGVLIAVWNWNWFKPIIQTKVSAATGLDVTISGNLGVKLGWTPEIDIPGITVQNPNWKGPAEDKTVLKVDDLLISIDLKKALGGTISLPEIIITKPVITLRRVGINEANWTTPKKQDDKTPTKRTAIPSIGLLQIKDGTVDYRDTVKNMSLKGALSTIEGNGGSGTDVGHTGFTLSGTGMLQNDPLTIKASGGPMLDLTDTTKPYPLSIDIELVKTRLKMNGSITDPTKLTGVDAELELEGPTLGELFPLLNIPAPETPPYHIKGRLVHKTDSWVYENFNGTVGGSDLGGSLAVDTSKPKLMITGELDSKKLDFKDIGPLIGIPPEGTATSTEQKKAAAAYHADQRVLPDAKLELGKVRSVNADVEWKVASVLAPHLPLDRVDLHVKLMDGILDLDPLDIGVAGGRVDSRIRIDARRDQVQTDYDIRLNQFKLGEFLDKAGFKNKGKGTISGRIQLHAPGNSVRESLGNSNGTVGVDMSQGEISDLALSAIGLDIGGVLQIVLTGDDKLIPIRCIAASFDVDDGLMKPNVFVFDTESTLVNGTGTINLKDEGLKLQLHAGQKTPSLLAAPTPIDIDGTFKHPSIGLDTTVLIERGAAAVALGIVLTPIGSLLAFIDPGTASNSDCAKELQDVKQAPTLHHAAQVRPSR